jgi:hypothetical protein
MSKESIAPTFGAGTFDCPYCHARAQQTWCGLATLTPDNHKTLEHLACDVDSFSKVRGGVPANRTKDVEAVKHIVAEGNPVAVYVWVQRQPRRELDQRRLLTVPRLPTGRALGEQEADLAAVVARSGAERRAPRRDEE